jgi:hypothetical protein
VTALDDADGSGRERHVVGIGLQMTTPGVPMVFAGSLPLAARSCRELETLYGADVTVEGGDVVLTAAGPSFNAWR